MCVTVIINSTDDTRRCIHKLYSPHSAGVKRLNGKINTVRETNLQYTLDTNIHQTKLKHGYTM